MPSSLRMEFKVSRSGNGKRFKQSLPATRFSKDFPLLVCQASHPLQSLKRYQAYSSSGLHPNCCNALTTTCKRLILEAKSLNKIFDDSQTVAVNFSQQEADVIKVGIDVFLRPAAFSFEDPTLPTAHA